MKLCSLFVFSVLFFTAGSAAASNAAFDELVADAGGAAPAAAVPVASLAASPEADPAFAAPILPDELTIQERILSLTDTLNLQAGGAKIGTVTQKFFSLTKSFTYVDAQNNCVANARARLLAWGTHIDVTDCSDRPIGVIKENVLKSFFKIWTTYVILDGQGREVATSEKVEWISTDLAIRRPDGRRVATLHRPWLNILGDDWTVKILDHAAVDSRLIILIAAYKTSVDHDRRQEKDDKNK